LQQPLPPPLPELLQLVLQQLPVALLLVPAVLAIRVHLAMPARLPPLMPVTKPTKIVDAVAVIAGRSGVEDG
jgi:hypothetical protein